METINKQIDALWLAKRIGDSSDYTRRGIAAKVCELVYTGEIAIGSKLPSSRELAKFLGVSQATVSAGWRILRKQRMISGLRSQGSWVCGLSGPYPERAHSLGDFESGTVDLTWSLPSAEFMPELSSAMQYGLQMDNLNSHLRVTIIPELEQQIRKRWCYPAAAFLATDDIYESLSSILGALLLPGATVAVEAPATVYLLDILDYINANVIFVDCDDEGPIPSSLEQALAQKPMAFLYQPNIHSFRGQPVSQQRVAEMAVLLQNNHIYLIEYDPVGDLSAQSVFSLGRHLPERTFYVRAYAAYGADLRLAVTSGPDELIRKVHAFRDFSSGWSSRILQGALAWLLQNKATQQAIASSTVVYQQRNQAFIDALSTGGIQIKKWGLFCLWLQVPDEQYTVATLAAQDIVVLPGSCCGEFHGNYIRISTSLLQPEQVSRVAEAVISAYQRPLIKNDKEI